MEIPDKDSINYKRMLDLSIDLICIAGMNGYFKYVNPAWERILGYTRDELLSRPFLDYIHPDDHAKNDEEMANLAAGRQMIDFENRYFHKNGSIRHISWTASPVPDEKQIYCIGRDITNRRKIEDTLKEKGSFLSTLINAIPIPVFYKNRAGQYTGFNEAFELFFGKTKEGLVGKSVFDISPRHLAETYFAKDIELFESGGKQEYESQVKNANGELRDVIFNKSVFKDNKGSVAGMVGAILDTTDRKRYEEKLAESKMLLDVTGRIAKVGGWELDAETLEVTWTEETYRIHEVPPDHKLSMQKAINFFHPEDRERLSLSIQRALSDGVPYDMEVRFTTAKGNHLWTRTICQPEIKNGKTVKLRGVFQDITDRKQVEESLQHREKQYRSLFNSIRDAILVADTNRTIVDCNPAFLDLFGYSREELLGKQTLSIYENEEEFRQLGAAIKDHVDDPGFLYTVHYRKRDGSVFPGETNVFYLRNDEDKVFGFIGLIRDITERKLVQEQQDKLIAKLQKTLSEVKTLRGFLPICSHCKKIRDEKGSWNQIEAYIRDHSEAEFSHGICRECAKKHYPDMDLYGE